MNLQTSIRRTVVPMVMGWLASLPIAPYVDERAVETALVAVLGALYYAVLRVLEERGIRIASLLIGLGVTLPPSYGDDSASTLVEPEEA